AEPPGHLSPPRPREPTALFYPVREGPEPRNPGWSPCRGEGKMPETMILGRGAHFREGVHGIPRFHHRGCESAVRSASGNAGGSVRGRRACSGELAAPGAPTATPSPRLSDRHPEGTVGAHHCPGVARGVAAV